MTDSSSSIFVIDGNWHMVVTTSGEGHAIPAGTELHDNVRVGLARKPCECAVAGLPLVTRR